ncbi:hypothetical protein [Streptomyces sp. NBC_01363]|uniref:hypothetical protein n=1 Tax=Streptomyces sp. NBC_01363 TaxID=2903840 RepID=UPI002253CE81|nr:hypothetical protein [Streptomyces sp. NBC_01363]MCX4733916.1 hypothetical protein [Streptomyces sp. NBC_01363]
MRQPNPDARLFTDLEPLVEDGGQESVDESEAGAPAGVEAGGGGLLPGAGFSQHAILTDNARLEERLHQVKNAFVPDPKPHPVQQGRMRNLVGAGFDVTLHDPLNPPRDHPPAGPARPGEQRSAEVTDDGPLPIMSWPARVPHDKLTPGP